MNMKKKDILKRREVGLKVAKIFGLSLCLYSLLETLGERVLWVFNLLGFSIIVTKRQQ